MNECFKHLITIPTYIYWKKILGSFNGSVSQVSTIWYHNHFNSSFPLGARNVRMLPTLNSLITTLTYIYWKKFYDFSTDRIPGFPLSNITTNPKWAFLWAHRMNECVQPFCKWMTLFQKNQHFPRLYILGKFLGSFHGSVFLVSTIWCCNKPL